MFFKSFNWTHTVKVYIMCKPQIYDEVPHTRVTLSLVADTLVFNEMHQVPFQAYMSCSFCIYVGVMIWCFTIFV